MLRVYTKYNLPEGHSRLVQHWFAYCTLLECRAGTAARWGQTTKIARGVYCWRHCGDGGAPLQIVIRELQSSTSSATNVKQSWVCTDNGTGTTLSCSCTTPRPPCRQPGRHQRRRDPFAGDYAYKPLVFDYFMKRNYPSSGGTYTLGENIYQKPRGQWPVLLPSNGTACPPPTFP